MSGVQEYAFTFRMIIPDKSPDDLMSIRDKLIEKSDETNTLMVVSTMDDYMTLTLNEDTEFPDERLSYATMLAKTALHELGVERPVFIKAFATLINGANLIDIHKQVVMESEADHIMNLTDVMIQNELGN